jgi:hypothetical protein
MKLLEERQKMIRLADRSEYGWDVVSEYQSDELAIDSDDEKRISKAEKAAEKKVLKWKKSVVGKAGNKSGRPMQQWGASSRQTGTLQAPPQAVLPWSRSPFMPIQSGTVSQPARGSRMPGPCFSCGEFGHLRNSCSKSGPIPAHKYPIIDENEYMYNTDESVGLFGECSSVNEVLGDDVEGESLLRYWEVGGQKSKSISVKGRLACRSDYWKSVLEVPAPVLNIITQGYILPFVSLPVGRVFENHTSAKVHAQFVREAIRELAIGGCVKEVEVPPVVCSPLLVVTSRSGKNRLVINLKYINRHLWKDKFKYEDLRTGLLMFEKDAFLCTFDLKSGYHHIAIHKYSQAFLGFRWEGKAYVFTVLPFGLATACYVFTKMLRQLVKYWRSGGMRIIMYIDDGIVVSPSLEKALSDVGIVRTVLECAGFVVNEEKSQWMPSHSVTWLGFEIDLRQGMIAIPTEKIENLKNLIKVSLQSRDMSAKDIAGIVGRIISMGLGIGPITRLRTRCLYALLESRLSWYDKLIVTNDATEELAFWLENLELVRVVCSDASDSGYGGYVVEQGCHIAHCQWNTEEMGKSSTWRELMAVARILPSVAHKLTNHRVRWFTDNQNVVRILTNGSRLPDLQTVAVEIFKFVFQNSISVEPEWIPRLENELADYISRIVDHDDWMLNPEVFGELDKLWGPHSVDRFEDRNNAQLSRFNSRFWNPGSEAMDAFTVNWSCENNWWCPPVSLIPRVLRHAQNCICEGTLIVPLWRSAVYWPMICPNGTDFAQFVKGSVVLPPMPGLTLPGVGGSQLFRNGVPNTEVMALRLSWLEL